MKKLIIISGLVLASLFLKTSLKADILTSYKLELNLNQDSSADIKLSVNLQNSLDTSVIQGYSVEMPFKIVNADAMLNGSQVDTLIEDTQGGTKLKVDFGNKIIQPNQNGDLQITLFTPKATVDKYSTNILILPYPSSNYNYQSVESIIKFPIGFGMPSYISENKYDVQNANDYTTITIAQSKQVLMTWGDPEYNAKVSVDLNNKKDLPNHYLLSLIPDSPSQNVNYININKADYALIDPLNNYFSFINFDPTSDIKINNVASVKITSGNQQITYPDKYNWNLNLDSTLGQKIYSQISQGSDTISKLKSLNDFLVNNFEIDSNVSLASLDKVWDNSNKSLNSLQFCYLVVSTAEYLGLKANIGYGYLIITPQLENTLTPKIWCQVNVDNKNITFDIPDEKQNNVSYFNNFYIDKLQIGIWHPTQTYNDILGLLDSSPINAEVDSSDYNIPVQTDIGIDMQFPDKVFSGEFYSGNLVFNNKTSKILTFSNLEINNVSVLENIKVGELTKALMPLQENLISVDYLRENDFVLNKTITLNTQAELKNGKVLNKNIDIKFEPDYKLLAVFVALALLIVLIIIYLGIKVMKRRF